MANKFENLDQVEPWYGTKYSISAITEETIKVGVSVLFGISL